MADVANAAAREGHDKHEQAGKTGIGVPGGRGGLSNPPTYQELLHYSGISGHDTPKSTPTTTTHPSFKPRSDDSELTVTVAATIRRAAALVGGHTMVGTWQPFTLQKDAGREIDPERHYMFALLEPLAVPLNGQDVVLGCVMRVRPSARIASVHGGEVQVVPHFNDTQHSGFLSEMPALPPGQQRVLVQEVPDQD